MKVRVLAVLAAVALVTGCSLTPPDPGPDAESTARAEERPDRLPDVELPAIDGGDPVDLGALRGPAVITLWASWCIPCKKELPILADFARGNDDVAVLGIDYQEMNKKKALAMMRTADVGFPVAYDFDGVTVRAIALPKLLMVDPTGKLVYNEYVPITSREQLADLVTEHLDVEVS